NPIGALPPPDPATAIFEQYNSANTQILNDMFGGQIGFRMSRRASRWNLSCETRAFALQNFQALSNSFNSITTEYPGVGVGNQPTENTYTKIYGGLHATQFVVGADIRTNAAFEVTRDVALNFGFQFFDLARGIGRGQDLNYNHQSVQIAGATFGITVKR